MNVKDTIAGLKSRAERGMDDPQCSRRVVQILEALDARGAIAENLGPLTNQKRRVAIAWVEGDLHVEIQVSLTDRV